MMQHPGKNNPQVIIIGGGASGLAAACILAKHQVPFVLLEKEQKLGRKLLATGNGRCNLYNTGEAVFFGDSAFAHQVLLNCGVTEVHTFFDSLGLVIAQEEGGRAYPATRQAVTVLDCLLGPLTANPLATIKTGITVLDIQQGKAGFVVSCSEGKSFTAPQVILATGSPAAPKLGGTDSLLPVLSHLGYPSLPFAPVLAPLVCDTAPIRGLSGLRVPANLTLYVGKDPVDAAAGEALFTDYGISGVCAMQLARAAREGLAARKAVTLSIDFSPLCGLLPTVYTRVAPQLTTQKEQSAKAMLSLLQSRQQKLPQDALYTGLLPRQLQDKVQILPLPQAAQLLTDFHLTITGTKGLDQAQAASGGLDCQAFSPDTLMSRLHSGLYATGEILNVDGDTGGFNLLFAWATGILAGGHAAGL